MNFSMTTASDEIVDGSAYLGSQLLDVQQPSMFNSTHTEESLESKSQFGFNSGSPLVDVLESDDLSDEIHMDVEESSSSLSPSPARSSQRPLDGQLNTSFKFGGLPRTQSSASFPKDNKQPLTLSDIIPSPSHAHSLSGSSTMDKDDSILKSIFAKITGPETHTHVSSKASARQIAW